MEEKEVPLPAEDATEERWLEALAQARLDHGAENDHPDIATSLSNLASLYTKQGRHDEAKPLFVDALAMRRRLYGGENDHPDIATSLSNLAALYTKQGWHYDNGELREIAQVALAKFEDKEALFKMGKNLYKETRSSGQPAVGGPEEAGRGEILSKSLELSNVDLAKEFVQLMTQSRNFKANAKVITTADEMAQEILTLKR